MILSNSLYLDSEYKADCEFKVNYLSVLEDKNDVTSKTTDVNDGEIDNKEELKETLESLDTRIIRDQSIKPTFTDGMVLYNTKKISDKIYKILLEIDNTTLQSE